MPATPTITIVYGSNNYTLEVNPYPVKITREPLKVSRRQSNGTFISYRKALKWSFEFNFPRIPSNMYNSLLAIREAQEPYYLVLTNMQPSGTFKVLWDGDLSCGYWSPLVDSGFTGNIKLEEV